MKAKSRLPHISEFDSKINRLLELNIDGINTNNSCAANATTKKIRSTFLEMAEMFKSFKNDIYTGLKTLGIRPKKTGTLVGAFNRLSMSMKMMLTSHNEAKALYQSIDHVHRVDNEYQFVLNKKEIIPKEILGLIEMQHSKIKSAAKQLDELQKII